MREREREGEGERGREANREADSVIFPQASTTRATSVRLLTASVGLLPPCATRVSDWRRNCSNKGKACGLGVDLMYANLQLRPEARSAVAKLRGDSDSRAAVA